MVELSEAKGNSSNNIKLQLEVTSLSFSFCTRSTALTEACTFPYAANASLVTADLLYCLCR